MKNSKLFVIILTLIFSISIMNFTVSAEGYTDKCDDYKNTALVSALETGEETADYTEDKLQLISSESEVVSEDESDKEDTKGNGSFFQNLAINGFLGMFLGIFIVLNMIVEFFSLLF